MGKKTLFYFVILSLLFSFLRYDNSLVANAQSIGDYIQLVRAISSDETSSDYSVTKPQNVLTTPWERSIGLDQATFGSPILVETTASLSTIGISTLRLTASDGEFMSRDYFPILVEPDPSITVLDVRVSSSTDDAEEDSTGGMTLRSSDLELVVEATTQTVGIRFTGNTISHRATITNAYIQFRVDEVSSGTGVLTIQGQTADNTLTFSDTSRDISNHPRTSTSVSWNPSLWTSVGATGADQQTPNIASLIQQIVNRPGWASGNSLELIYTGSGTRTAVVFDCIQSVTHLGRRYHLA